jgi:hypothetical protein
MRATIIILFLLIVFFGCNPSKSINEAKIDTGTEAVTDTIRIQNEELQYEIIILEVGFEAWLATQRPMWYYTQSLLENRNKYYVLEWNRRAGFPNQFDPLLYNQSINYQFNIDYGKEVNYLLFMYFEFFQQKYNQRL